MSKTFYTIRVDNDIMDVYSVNYLQNRKAIDNAGWYEWMETNIRDNIDSSVPELINLPRLIHNPKTPLTDMLDIHTFPGRGGVVSKKFVEVIKNFNLPSLKSFPVEISYKSKVYEYEYLFFIQDHSEQIDFTKTSFDVDINRITYKDRLITYSEWMHSIKTEKWFYPESKNYKSKITFQNFSEDFFILFKAGSSNLVIITDQLKSKMQNELFGINFLKCEFFIMKAS